MKRPSYDKEIINRGEGFYEVQCVECEQWFQASRYDAAFCSSKCRTKHHRGLKNLDMRIKRANDAIDELIKYLPSEGKSRTFDALEKLHQRIENVLAYVSFKG